MKVTALLLTLLGWWMVSAGLAAVGPAALDGREAFVRIYDSPEVDPAVFDVVSVRLQRFSIRLDSFEIGDSAIVAVVPRRPAGPGRS